jgi:hypothetical protein
MQAFPYAVDGPTELGREVQLMRSNCRWFASFVALAVGLGTIAAQLRGDDSPGQGTLSGSVVNAAGKAVAGARVSIHKHEFDSKSLTASTRMLAETKTDDAGRFRLGPLEGVYRPSYDFRIEAAGYAPQYVADGTYSIFPDADCALGPIQLNPGCVVSGQVVDADGGPRAGVKVHFNVWRYVMGHTAGTIEPSGTVAADAEGRFRTPPLPIGRGVAYVDEPERQRAYEYFTTGPAGEVALAAPLRLERDVPVEGIVQDEGGRAIEGAVVRAGSDARPTTDAQGRFAIRGFGQDAQFQLGVQKDGFVFVNWGVKRTPEGISWVEVGPGERDFSKPAERLVVVMKRSAWIEGRAVDAETGEPIKLDKVMLCLFTRRPNGEIALANCTSQDFEQPEPGHFRIGYSQPDDYHLTLSAAGYHDGEAFTPPVKELTPIGGLVVKLERNIEGTKPQIAKQSIAGAVTRDGKPVKSGWVSLWLQRTTSNIVNTPILRGRTTGGNPAIIAKAPIRDGAYELEVPPQGTNYYGVVVEGPARALTQLWPIKVAAGEHKKFDIACPPGGSIRGRVKNVPEGWQGNLWAVAFSRTAVRAETRVAADGTFSFEALPGGQYGLKVGHDAYIDSEVPSPESLKDVPKEAFTILSDPWKRAVKVSLKAGSAVEGVELELPSD